MRNSGRGSFLPGFLISLVLEIIMVLFCLMLHRMGFLRLRYTVAAAAVLTLPIILAGFCMSNSEKKGRFIIGLILTLVLACVFGGGTVFAYKLSDFFAAIEENGNLALGQNPGQDQGQNQIPAAKKDLVQNNILTVYLSGIDTQDEDASADQAGRSDVNIIAMVNLSAKQALLVSTPRDYFVPLSISNGVPDKLTHAGIYGIDVSMDTLGMLYGIDLEHFVRVDFAGFVKIIDALGGVNVYSDYEFDSQNILGYHFVQGYNQMDGEAALVFARERFAFEEGDRQRGKNQMAVIEAIVDKVASMESFWSIPKLLASLQGALSTNIPVTQLISLAQSQVGADLNSWKLVTYEVDGYGDTQVPYSLSEAAYVMIPDETSVEQAKELMRQLQAGELNQG
ncbi:MAG: LCP family protein [Blautia sp.]|nr:LCP family protein [Blautia sp.]